MAGIKSRKGLQINHQKYEVDGRPVRPCQVYQRKTCGNGYRRYGSANFIDSGETVQDNNGVAIPWRQIRFD